MKVVDRLDTIKKNSFVETYQKTNGNITDSCAVAGISRQTYYNWLEKEEGFRTAIIEAESNLNDEIRQVLISKAADGDMTAVIFYLKNRHPDYKQKPQEPVNPNVKRRIVAEEFFQDVIE